MLHRKLKQPENINESELLLLQVRSNSPWVLELTTEGEVLYGLDEVKVSAIPSYPRVLLDEETTNPRTTPGKKSSPAAGNEP